MAETTRQELHCLSHCSVVRRHCIKKNIKLGLAHSFRALVQFQLGEQRERERDWERKDGERGRETGPGIGF